VDPLNPEEQTLLSLDLSLYDDPDTLALIERLDDNVDVTMKWRNASLTMKAGSFRAILGLPLTP
jgi:hypothetical protein